MTNDDLANLFILGASKCGITFLHDLLDQHSDMYMSKLKELFHFTNENSSENEYKYNVFFSNGKNYKYRGELTLAYLETTYFKGIPKKIPKDLWDDELRDKIHKILLPEVNKIHEYLNIDHYPWRFKKK